MINFGFEYVGKWKLDNTKKAVPILNLQNIKINEQSMLLL